MEDSSSVYMSKCLMSPSCCVPRHEQYGRLPPPTPGGERNGSHRSRRFWRKMLWRVVRESNKCIYRCNRSSSNNNHKLRNPPLTFQYDAVSYAQNFDEGCHFEDCHYFQRLSPVVIK